MFVTGLQRGGFTTRVLIVEVLSLVRRSPGVVTVAVFLDGLIAVAVGKTVILIGGATAPGLKGSAASA